MDIYKKWNIGLSILFGLIVIGTWVYWEYICGGHKCSLQLLDWTLDPLLWGSIPLTIIFVTFLFLPAKLFKQWLLHVCSWSIPFALFMILSTDPRSSNILSLDRGQVAWLLGTILLIITFVYTIGWYIYEWRKGRIVISDFSRLAVLLVPTALFYVIWQQF